jgi:hypothetical protein
MRKVTPLLSSGNLNGQTLKVELVEPSNDLPKCGSDQVASETDDHQPRHLRPTG